MSIHNVYLKLNKHQRAAVDAVVRTMITELREQWDIQPSMADGAEVVVEQVAKWVSTATRPSDADVARLVAFMNYTKARHTRAEPAKVGLRAMLARDHNEAVRELQALRPGQYDNLEMISDETSTRD